MKKQVVNNVSANDVRMVQAALVIPLAITILCSTFDILFHIRLDNTEFKNCEECLLWMVETLIAYFFPSFMAIACSMAWQYFFTDIWSGIKEEKGNILACATLIYFVLYIIYLLFENTIFVYAFVVISLIYVWLVLKKCIDGRIFIRSSNRPKSKIINFPN